MSSARYTRLRRSCLWLAVNEVRFASQMGYSGVPQPDAVLCTLGTGTVTRSGTITNDGCVAKVRRRCRGVVPVLLMCCLPRTAARSSPPLPATARHAAIGSR